MKVICSKKNIDIEHLEALLYSFCFYNDIKIDTVHLDLRKTKNNYKNEGVFGGFLDMYKRFSHSMYINPHNFVEFDGNLTNINLIAHLCMHELVHCKQIQENRMRIGSGGNTLLWKSRIYRRVPFKVDIFNRIREYDGGLAEEYHYSTIPWEKEAYQLPEEFMGQALWEKY